MSHPSARELHQVAYGLATPPAHLEDCLQCREDLASIEAERTGLRDILRGDLDAPSRKRHGGRPLQIAAVAGLLLGLMALLVAVPGRPPAPAEQNSPDKVEQLLDRIEKLTAEATRLEVEIADLERAIQLTRNMLDPEYMKKQQLKSKTIPPEKKE